jgi:ribonucleoside-triphosphate reductase
MNEPKVCGQKCLVYSRVCGFITPTHLWNKGKRSEYRQRREFAAPALDDPQLVERINEAMVKRFGGF